MLSHITDHPIDRSTDGLITTKTTGITNTALHNRSPHSLSLGKVITNHMATIHITKTTYNKRFHIKCHCFYRSIYDGIVTSASNRQKSWHSSNDVTITRATATKVKDQNHGSHRRNAPYFHIVVLQCFLHF